MRVIRTVERKNERWHEIPEVKFTGTFDTYPKENTSSILNEYTLIFIDFI